MIEYRMRNNIIMYGGSKNIKSTSKVNMGIESYNPFAPLQFYTNYNEQ